MDSVPCIKDGNEPLASRVFRITLRGFARLAGVAGERHLKKANEVVRRGALLLQPHTSRGTSGSIGNQSIKSSVTCTSVLHLNATIGNDELQPPMGCLDEWACFLRTSEQDGSLLSVSRKRKRSLPPRTLRMNRAGRLQSAPRWLATQTGRPAIQIAKSYRKRFGVDWPCAVGELSMLGIRLDAVWVAQLYRALEGAQCSRHKGLQSLKAEEAEHVPDSDEHFAYIAGYTPGGWPFGVTWAEWRQMEAASRQATEG